jgi:hypothetical protein
MMKILTQKMLAGQGQERFWAVYFEKSMEPGRETNNI